MIKLLATILALAGCDLTEPNPLFGAMCPKTSVLDNQSFVDLQSDDECMSSYVAYTDNGYCDITFNQGKPFVVDCSYNTCVVVEKGIYLFSRGEFVSEYQDELTPCSPSETPVVLQIGDVFWNGLDEYLTYINITE